MLFLLGFLLFMLGFAMVVLGQVRLTETWVLSRKVSRVTGSIFLSFFPLVFAVRFGLYVLEWEEILSPTLINWLMFVLVLMAGGGYVWWASRVPKPPGPRLAPGASEKNLFSEPAKEPASASPPAAPENLQWLPPPVKPLPRSGRREQNPFDFS